MRRVFGFVTAFAVATMLLVGNTPGALAWGHGGGRGGQWGGGGFRPLARAPMATPMVQAPMGAMPYGGMPGAMPGLSAQQFAQMHNQYLQQNYQRWNQSLPGMGIPMQQFPQQQYPQQQYPPQYAGGYGGYGGYGGGYGGYGYGGGGYPGYGGGSSGGYGNGLGGICFINCTQPQPPYQVPTQALAGTLSPFMYYQLQAGGIDPGMTGIIPQTNPAYPTGYNFGGVRMSFGSGY